MTDFIRIRKDGMDWFIKQIDHTHVHFTSDPEKTSGMTARHINEFDGWVKEIATRVARGAMVTIRDILEVNTELLEYLPVTVCTMFGTKEFENLDQAQEEFDVDPFFNGKNFTSAMRDKNSKGEECLRFEEWELSERLSI